jgi:hypothetical protein
MAGKRIETKSGFVCEIDEAVVNDMEVLDLVVEIEKGNVLKYPLLLEKLLGADLKQKLYDHVRVDGRVPYDAVDAEVSDIFSGIGGGKN